MTKTESIKSRKMGKSEIAKLEALAKFQSREDAKVTGETKALEGVKPGPTATESNIPAPKSVETLVTYYYNTYVMKYPAEIAAALTQAAMNLEGAALIAKTLKEK